jgi:cell division protease FtsH
MALTQVKMKQPKVRSISLLYLLIFAFGIALIFWVFRATPAVKPEEIPISQVVTMSQADEIKKIVVEGQWLNITTQDGTALKSFKGDIGLFDIKDLKLTGVDYVIKPTGINWWS